MLNSVKKKLWFGLGYFCPDILFSIFLSIKGSLIISVPLCQPYLGYDKKHWGCEPPTPEFKCPPMQRWQCGRNCHFLVFNFQLYKHWYLINTWPDKAFKGTVVNLVLLSLLKGALEITLTVPLIQSSVLLFQIKQFFVFQLGSDRKSILRKNNGLTLLGNR